MVANSSKKIRDSRPRSDRQYFTASTALGEPAARSEYYNGILITAIAIYRTLYLTAALQHDSEIDSSSGDLRHARRAPGARMT